MDEFHELEEEDEDGLEVVLELDAELEEELLNVLAPQAWCDHCGELLDECVCDW